LLFENYVVEVPVMEAIEKNAFLKEVEELIDEDMPSLKKQESFFGLFGLTKYPATTRVQLQNISDNKKEFRDTLTAEGIPKAICDLLFEKYVATKKRSASDESAGDRKRQCVKQNGDGDMDVFCRELSTGKGVVDGGAEFIQFKQELLGMGEYPKGIFVRKCFESMYQKVNNVFKNTPDVKSKKFATIMGTPGIGKTLFGLFMIHELFKEGKSVMYYHGGVNKYFQSPKIVVFLKPLAFQLGLRTLELLRQMA